MRQVVQSLKNGKIELIEVSIPLPVPNSVVIQTSLSLLSAGTEKMLLNFGRSSFLSKLRSQPDKVRQVFSKMETDGIGATLEAVFNKLNTPIPLGYCNVGIVVDVGVDVKSLKKGDRVVSNGYHSEFNCVSENLCAKIPNDVKDEDAVYTVLGAIALQGIRLAKPTIGETAVIYGLGVIGILAAQILMANGCKVVGLDIDQSRVKLSKKFGINSILITKEQPPEQLALSQNNNKEIDLVILTTATDSSEPMKSATKMLRKRGRIVLTGVAGLNLSRDLFYEKEINFCVSCSYGPGRYDPDYELKGFDYPEAFVRWTEKRNFEAILNLLSDKKMTTKLLTTHKYEFGKAFEAYEALLNEKSSVGILLEYSSNQLKNNQNKSPKKVPVNVGAKPKEHKSSLNRSSNVKIGIIGAGNYSQNMLIPNLISLGADLNMICSIGGTNAGIAAHKYGINRISSNAYEIINDEEIDAVIIATRHDSHGDLVAKALSQRKHVYVEKPMAISESDLNKIKKQYEALSSKPVLMTGFNRRFAYHAKILKKFSGNDYYKTININVNAGVIPKSHWIHDLKIGGGRLIGEACHFVDLSRFIAGSEIIEIRMLQSDLDLMDNYVILIKFKDGSLANINYFTNGSKKYQKERLEVYCNGKVLVIDNWLKCKIVEDGRTKKYNLWKQDKGTKACLKYFLQSINNPTLEPIPIKEQFEVMTNIFGLKK
ncbi:bi-domain-containing oxidoreductase [Alphaproteobacteria bacterium]|nr:bi-domain-containing oxidoreductase [Alphaproteobacteria bacterium]